MPIGYQPSAVGAARQALINQGLVAAPMQLHKPEESKAAYVAELEINDFPQQARFKVRGLCRHTWVATRVAIRVVGWSRLSPNAKLPRGGGASGLLRVADHESLS